MSMNARLFALTTKSLRPCWKKNMYQLRCSCSKLPTNALPIAPHGGTPIPTTRLHRSGARSAAPYVAGAPQSCPIITASELPPSTSCNAFASVDNAAVWYAPFAATDVGANPRMNGATAQNPASASFGSRCRHVFAESGKPCRQSASGPLPHCK